jgi:signal peptide peptidase SppA
MKYANILLAVQSEIWALEEAKLAAIIDFLSYMAAGHTFTAEEIEAKIGKGAAQAVARQEGAVAVLPLQGVIGNRMNLMTSISGGTSSEMFGRQFQSAIRDDSVKAVVIDVNSPGGAVDGTDELSSMIFNARGSKPIISHVNANANSAAYWIATAADEMVITPGFASVGNIGVRTAHDDMSKAMADQGVTRTLISAGKYKDEGNPLGPLTDEARAAIQARVDKAYGSFVKSIARNRNVSLATVRDGFGQGRSVDGDEAVALGMADSTATLEETLNRFGASMYSRGPTSSVAAPAASRTFATQREKRALALRDL